MARSGAPGERSASPTARLEQLVYELGERLGAALVQGAPLTAARAARAIERESRAGDGRRAVCAVPACGRGAIAKELCAAHYRKARRLGLGERLTPAQLHELGQDRRKLRPPRAA